MKYCISCGNTGVDLMGRPCECQKSRATFLMSQLAAGSSTLSVPEQYQGLVFNADAMSNVDMQFRAEIKNLYLDITHGAAKAKTFAISCPPNSGKKVFAYSCNEQIFRKQMKTFPVLDVLQLNRVLADIDSGRSIVYPGIKEPKDFYVAPYLFAIVPPASFPVYDAINLIKSRRVANGHTTVFLLDTPWAVFTALDKAKRLTTSVGTGAYSSIKVMESGF